MVDIPTQNTWPRDLSVLKAIVNSLEEKPWQMVNSAMLSALTGLSDADLDRAFVALRTADPPFFNSTRTAPNDFDIASLTERARRATGVWPSPESAITQLIAALSHAAESEVDPEKKRKLKQAADIIGGAALQVAVAWASQA